jgi:hypothetical protein
MLTSARLAALGALTLVVVSSTCFGQVNILVNPGFESGVLDPWYHAAGSGPEIWNVTSADAHTGTYCATSVGNNRIEQDFTGLPTEEIIEISYWLKQPESVASAYDFFYSDGTVDQNVVHPSGTDWEHFDVTASLAPGKTLIGLGIWGYVGGGPGEDRTYLDDVVIMVLNPPCPADVNGDGVVNVMDLLAVFAVWGATSGPEDINGDGIVNVLDLLEVLIAWGPC